MVKAPEVIVSGTGGRGVQSEHPSFSPFLQDRDWPTCLSPGKS
jgi:hypothetical protein